MVPDVFPEFDGYRPPVKRSQIDPFTGDDAYAVLYGDGTGHGHHAFGQNKGKNEFPPGWKEAEVVAWTNYIIDHPTGAVPAGRNPEIEFDLFGIYRGVYGRVCVRYEERHFIVTCYPESL